MPTSNFRINEVGNQTLHERHRISLQEVDGSKFLQAKVNDQLFIDHLLLEELIDLDQHSRAEYIVFLASTSGSFAKAPAFGGIPSDTPSRTDMLSNPLIKLGNKLKYIRKGFGDEGIRVVTDHVILDRWTQCQQTIEFLGLVLGKKRPASKES